MPFTKETTKLGSIASGKVWKEKRRQNIIKYNKFPKTCLLCNTSIDYDRRVNEFCSHSCSAKHNNEKNRKTPILYCRNCDNQLNCDQKISCSKKCKYEYWLKNTKKLLDENKIKTNGTIRKYLIEVYGRHCFVCKKKVWMNKPIPIDVDHIDGHSENNIKTNVRLICLNCHGQTSTYKQLNKGNGREFRRKNG